jgi:archaellum component FlaD/FlaE
LEQHHRNQLAVHAEEVVEAKQKKQRKKENQALEKARAIEKAPWVETESEVDDMTVPAIKMQLEKYWSCIEDILKKIRTQQKLEDLPLSHCSKPLLYNIKPQYLLIDM